jgi:hypothetical protein
MPEQVNGLTSNWVVRVRGARPSPRRSTISTPSILHFVLLTLLQPPLLISSDKLIGTFLLFAEISNINIRHIVRGR